MPKGDRTGPGGQGSKTGRAAGYCAGFSTPGYVNPAGGKSFRAGRGTFGGRGRGMMHRHWHHAACFPGWIRHDMGYPACGTVGIPYGPPDMEPGEEKEVLKEQADLLKQHLDDIQERMTELEKDKKTK